MRNIILVFCFVLGASFLKSQINLVPNPSFEMFSACPDNISGTADDQVSRATGWSSWIKTPDYYNTCANTSHPVCGVPNNWVGYQNPHTGNAYCGIIPYQYTLTSFWREAIGAQLSSPLIVGQKYFLSFFISSAGHYWDICTDKIGMKFTTIPYSYIDTIPINNSAAFYSSSIICDTVNWVKLSGSFIADSAYNYVVVGNFFDDAHTDTLINQFYNGAAYYFIDDICVSTDSVFANTWTRVGELEDNINISIFPNPSSGIINVEFNEWEPPDIWVYNSFGQAVLPKMLFTQNNIELNFKELNEGIYFLKIQYNQKTISKKILIIK